MKTDTFASLAEIAQGVPEFCFTAAVIGVVMFVIAAAITRTDR